MKLQLRLSDVDRKRYGCPEWMDIDLETVSFREVIAMQKGFLVEGELVAFDTAGAWRQAWVGRPVLGDDGQPVKEDLLDPQTGEPVLDEETGQPQQVVKTVGDWGAALVGVWLALRRAGAKVALDDVADCDPERVEIRAAPDDPGVDREPGKDGSDPETTS